MELFFFGMRFIYKSAVTLDCHKSCVRASTKALSSVVQLMHLFFGVTT